VNEHPSIAAELVDLLRVSHLLEPDDLPEVAERAARRAGATAIRILLADYEQHELNHLAPKGTQPSAPELVDATVAGRVFRTNELVHLDEGGGGRLLLPLLDGTHRLGVLEVCLPAGTDSTPEQWAPFSALTAKLAVTKSSFGDGITMVQRTRQAAVRAEAQRELLPPLTLSSPRVLITGMLVPSYEVAGDVFDYSLTGDTLQMALFDAMGHSLSATLIATVALAAYRNSRRSGGSLLDHHRLADDLVGVEFAGERFATAIFAELDLPTGRLRSVSAGHPSAVVMRDHRVVAHCADDPTLPVGLGGSEPKVTTTQLEPGDRLLMFTDGVVEARSDDGEFFGEDRLVEHVGRELDSGLPGPEAVRRVLRAVASHQRGRMRDDATLLMVEWPGPDRQTVPDGN
jgi:hypothetical protein